MAVSPIWGKPGGPLTLTLSQRERGLNYSKLPEPLSRRGWGSEKCEGWRSVACYDPARWDRTPYPPIGFSVLTGENCCIPMTWKLDGRSEIFPLLGSWGRASLQSAGWLQIPCTSPFS